MGLAESCCQIWLPCLTSGALAGETVQASAWSLPAATTTSTPASYNRLTASLTLWDSSPVFRDIDTMAGFMWFSMTQFIPVQGKINIRFGALCEISEVSRLANVSVHERWSYYVGYNSQAK